MEIANEDIYENAYYFCLFCGMYKCVYEFVVLKKPGNLQQNCDVDSPAPLNILSLVVGDFSPYCESQSILFCFSFSQNLISGPSH